MGVVMDHVVLEIPHVVIFYPEMSYIADVYIAIMIAILTNAVVHAQ
jgi:hypothetical protein